MTSPSLKVYFPALKVPLASSIFMSPAPTIQHLPHPRQTSAAWLVMPPRAVRMPSAARMPSTSSGFVSSRTRIDLIPFAASSTAFSEVNTILPTAPPGPAGSPLVMISAFFSALGSRIGCRSSSSWFGEILVTAVALSISFSSSMSIAILSAAVPVLLPTRHWSM